MPKRQRQQKQDSKHPSTTAQDERQPTSAPQDEVNDDGDEVQEAGERPRRTKSLKHFIEQVKGKHYRVIEMRVALVCSFGVFAKLIFSDALAEVDDTTITHSAVAFAGCKLH